MMNGQLAILRLQRREPADPLNVAKNEKVTQSLIAFDNSECALACREIPQIQVPFGKHKAGHAGKLLIADLVTKLDRFLSCSCRLLRFSLGQETSPQIPHRLDGVPLALLLLCNCYRLFKCV